MSDIPGLTRPPAACAEAECAETEPLEEEGKEVRQQRA